MTNIDANKSNSQYFKKFYYTLREKENGETLKEIKEIK